MVSQPPPEVRAEESPRGGGEGARGGSGRASPVPGSGGDRALRGRRALPKAGNRPDARPSGRSRSETPSLEVPERRHRASEPCRAPDLPRARVPNVGGPRARDERATARAIPFPSGTSDRGSAVPILVPPRWVAGPVPVRGRSRTRPSWRSRFLQIRDVGNLPYRRQRPSARRGSSGPAHSFPRARRLLREPTPKHQKSDRGGILGR